MKNIVKMSLLIAVSILTTIIIYPFLHEMGHALVALSVGANIVDFSLLPVPFIACEILAVDNTGQILIGLGGVLFPYIFSMLVKPRLFWIWYVNCLIKSISIYSAIISIVAIGFYEIGYSWTNEDIIQVLQLSPRLIWIYLIVFLVISVYGIRNLVKEKIVLRFIENFTILK